MPLPKPPAKRADMLSTADYESQPKPAKTGLKRGSKNSSSVVAIPPAAPRIVPAQPPVLELVPRPLAAEARAKAPA
ncbi:MAG: PhoH family protein, partial [Aquabacterium sp.]